MQTTESGNGAGQPAARLYQGAPNTWLGGSKELGMTMARW
jgi:hypothetical protein